MYVDEIIRQITLINPERGNMFIRVRDEIKKNINSYQKLNESVLTFGMRKSLLVISSTISTQSLIICIFISQWVKK
jgi:hypothetical protein